MKKLWTLYTKCAWEKKTLITGAGLALLPILGGIWFQAGQSQTPVTKRESVQVDTFIPKGFVLVPIEVQNYESLDALLGNFGVVDLFQARSPEGGNQTLVAKNVRILRAPQNPTHFAILVQEQEVGSVLKNGGTFTVIVKGPGKSGTEFVKEKTSRRSITYERE